MRKVKFFITHHSSYVCAVLFWLVMLLILWYLENKVYGGNLEVGFKYALIIPPISALLYYYSCTEDRTDRLKHQTTYEKKLSNQLTNFISLVFGLYLLWLIIFENPYQAGLYELLAILLFFATLAYISRVKKQDKISSKKESAWIVSILIGVITLVGLGFCIIARPMTVKEGQRLVTDIGYEGVEYAENIKNTITLRLTFRNNDLPLPESEDGMNFYLYLGIKNGESYGILVSLVGHRIVAEVNAENNNTLMFYLRNSQ